VERTGKEWEMDYEKKKPRGMENGRRRRRRRRSKRTREE
jgi:hypothetical protein